MNRNKPRKSVYDLLNDEDLHDYDVEQCDFVNSIQNNQANEVIQPRFSQNAPMHQKKNNSHNQSMPAFHNLQIQSNPVSQGNMSQAQIPPHASFNL